ncbi:MAG: hypothetical protein ACYCPS_02585 [Candidatus Saccharimonadales bacterium]
MEGITISSRKVQLVIGVLWLLAGCLQLQPKMFTSGFITHVINPAVAGQPFFIYDPIHFASKVFLTHPAVFNSLIALIQISIGLLILYKKTAKYGLWLSIIWGLFVWSFGEAFGGIFSGQTSLISGMPGSALLYSLISFSVLDSKKENGKTIASGWLIFVWLGIWVMGAIYELLPTQNSLYMLKAMVLSNASSAPSWLAAVDKHAAKLLNQYGSHSHMVMASMNGTGYMPMFILAMIMLVIGLGVFMPKRIRASLLIIGILLMVVFWVVGQSLGGYFTGYMTDVNTAPLIILLGLTIMSQPNIGVKLKSYYLSLERVLT